MNEQLVGELDTNSRLTIHLNPVHVWSRFETKALLGDDDAAPATVLFYPVGNDIRTAVIEAECEQLIHLLEQHGVMRIKDLKKLFPAEEHGSLVALLKDLAEMGMIALG
jgi:hypothetical protein